MTLIREYIQSTNAMGYSLPTGSFDRRKHASLKDVAIAELAEEAWLEGGTLAGAGVVRGGGVPFVSSSRFARFIYGAEDHRCRNVVSALAA